MTATAKATLSGEVRRGRYVPALTAFDRQGNPIYSIYGVEATRKANELRRAKIPVRKVSALGTTCFG